jgi:Flagellar hook-length control protein FliK
MDIVSLPSLLGIPNSFGAPPSALQPGEIVDALVVALLDSGLVRLQVPDGTIDVRTAVPLTVGAKVRLAVNGTSAGLQLVVLTDGSGRAGTPATLVTRQPADAPARAAAAPEAAAGAAFEAPAVEIAVSGASAASVPQTASPALSPATGSLAEAVQVAAARQGGLAPLFADLEQAVIAEALPASVAAAAARVIDLRLPFDGLDAAGLRQALARSGLFLEAGIAAALASGTAFSAGMDLKAALLMLRQMLKAWSDAEPAPASAASAAPASAPPPPYRGAPPSAQPAVPPSLPMYAPTVAVGQRLLAETDAALARQTLLQVASLPEAGGSAQAAQRSAQWAFEIPFAAGQGSAIAQFEISRDGHGAAAHGPSVWRVRFSLNVEPMGPVHALIAVAGDRAAVTLWAEREASAARLRAGSGLLADALRAAALEPGDIQFRVGAPAAPPPAAGRFLDRAS